MSGMKKDNKVMEYELKKFLLCVFLRPYGLGNGGVPVESLAENIKKHLETLVFQLPASFFILRRHGLQLSQPVLFEFRKLFVYHGIILGHKLRETGALWYHPGQILYDISPEGNHNSKNKLCFVGKVNINYKYIT